MQALYGIWFTKTVTIGDLTESQNTELDALYEEYGEETKADNRKDFIKSKLRMLYIKYANSEVVFN